RTSETYSDVSVTANWLIYYDVTVTYTDTWAVTLTYYHNSLGYSYLYDESAPRHAGRTSSTTRHEIGREPIAGNPNDPPGGNPGGNPGGDPGTPGDNPGTPGGNPGEPGDGGGHHEPSPAEKREQSRAAVIVWGTIPVDSSSRSSQYNSYHPDPVLMQEQAERMEQAPTWKKVLIYGAAGATAAFILVPIAYGLAPEFAALASTASKAATEFGDDASNGLSKPMVSDSKLQSLMNELYRAGAKVGSGSTADAIRYEMKTGDLLSPSGHLQKGVDYARALENWLQANPNASSPDRAAAQAVLEDLKNALQGR
ncbi:MAG: hypothetical protein M1602_04775, partial [Firmicutes bacterium]|nr:hypothetical protein [Bacillota bacterium]